MMNPLLRLRQACCHPQLVRGKIITMSLQKSSVTMEELLDRLILKTKAECVDCHRQIIFALNGRSQYSMPTMLFIFSFYCQA
jgi:E3 ubiquitin-protein ligase SHPRH